MEKESLPALVAFASVASHRSFRRAATELGVSPSALSHTLRKLEARLEVRLLNRSTRSVVPTEAGEALLADLAPALERMRSAVEAVNRFRDTPVGKLRLNAPYLALDAVLGERLPRFLAAHPGVSLEVVSDDKLTDIVGAGFDAGVRFDDRLQPDMVAQRIGPPLSFVVVATPAYWQAHTKPQTPWELQQHACVQRRFPSGERYRWEFAQEGQRLRVTVDGRLVVDNARLEVMAARQGFGVVYCLRQLVEADLAAGTLESVLDGWMPPPEHFHLYYPSRRHLPSGLRALVDYLREDSEAR